MAKQHQHRCLEQWVNGRSRGKKNCSDKRRFGQNQIPQNPFNSSNSLAASKLVVSGMLRIITKNMLALWFINRVKARGRERRDKAGWNINLPSESPFRFFRFLSIAKIIDVSRMSRIVVPEKNFVSIKSMNLKPSKL